MIIFSLWTNYFTVVNVPVTCRTAKAGSLFKELIGTLGLISDLKICIIFPKFVKPALACPHIYMTALYAQPYPKAEENDPCIVCPCCRQCAAAVSAAAALQSGEAGAPEG